MAAPVKVSDRLLALAREEARSTHRSATAQIEHWATLGRAVEVMMAYGDVLALKRAGEALPVPASVRRQDVHALLARLAEEPDREAMKARIRASGGPFYTVDAERPGLVVQVAARGARTAGRIAHRRFVPARGKSTTRKK